MIWVVFAGLVGLCALALAPAFFGRVEPATDNELSDYFAQIDALRNDDSESAVAARTALERRVLARKTGTISPSGTMGAIGLAALGIAGFGLYALTGTPIPPTSMPPSSTAANDMDALIVQLEQRLATDRADDPQGWLIYARTLRSLGRDVEARAAFDRAAALSSEPGPITAERDQIRGPSAADIEAANAMSAEDRAAMIQNMVDGLSERLQAEPNNPQGWVRLIRARLQLGQREQARIEVERLRRDLASEPETVQRILSEAGWSDE